MTLILITVMAIAALSAMATVVIMTRRKGDRSRVTSDVTTYEKRLATPDDITPPEGQEHGQE